MRRHKVCGVLAAAITAIPSVSFAGGDDVGLAPFTAEEMPMPHLGKAEPALDRLGGRFRIVLPTHLSGGPDADVDGTFLGGVNDPGDGTMWFTAANWTTNPQIPDGAAAIARFTKVSNGASVTLGGAGITLSQLDLSDPQFNAIVNGGLTLTGAAVISGSNDFFNPPTTIFSANALGTATSLFSIGGTAGLTKTGPAPATLNSPNTYMGATNINDGPLVITTGDTALGNAANQVNLNNNGALDIRTANLVTARTINVGAGGGRIFWAGSGRTFEHSGDITGSGPLALFGNFVGAGTPDTAATFSTAKSYSGPLTLGGGTFNISDAGAVANASAILNQGTVALRQGGSGTSVNRIGDTTPVTLFGSTLRAHGNAVAYTETMGNLVLDGTTSWIQVDPGDGGVTLQFANIIRNNKGSVAFRGEGLGSAADARVTQVHFNNGTGSLVGGIIPWAYGNNRNDFNPDFTRPESEFNTLVTYGANGVTPITSYATDINTSTANDNVLISDSGANVTGDRFANALVLRVTDAYASTPMTVTGNGVIHLTTGVILSGNAGLTTTFSINSTPGNVVDANIDAGSNELIIQTPSAVSFNGVLSGSGGMTKTGGRTGFFNNNNTYTGETNLGGFVRFNRSVPNGAPSPFGNSTTPIVLYSGNMAPFDAQFNAVTGTMSGILALDTNSGAASFDRPLTIRGTGTSLLRNFSNGVLTFNGAINVEQDATLQFQSFGTNGGGSDQMVVNSVISGPGLVQTRTSANGAVTPGAFVELNGNNTFTGGFDAGGFIRVGHNNALGAGQVIQNNTTTFSAVGGARNISNPLLIFGQGVGFGVAGDQPFTWSGSITGMVGQTVLPITNTSTTTFAGTIVQGEFFKQGPGTLVLSGNNTFDGLFNLGNGSNSGGVLYVDSDTAFGSTVSGAGVNADAIDGGGNSIVVRGGRNIPDELIFVRGIGTGGMAALHGANGNNNWGGRVIASAQYINGGTPGVSVLSHRMTLGADAGASLHIARSISTLDAGASDGATTVFLAPSIGVSKLGGGLVSVGSDIFTADIAAAGTSSFRGSLLASGSVDIQGGTLRMSNMGTPPGNNVPSVADVAAISIAGGPGAPTAKLDLGRNAMVVDYSGASPLTDIQSYINAARAGGAWTGNGITSSDLAGLDQTRVDLFAFDTAVSGVQASSTFLGDPVDATAVLVFPALKGDANLDWRVNLADFNTLAGNFGQSNRIWTQGNFNGDNIVNLADFNILAGNFGFQAGPDGPTPEDWATLAAAIPEPGAMMFVALGAVSLLRRRRRA